MIRTLVICALLPGIAAAETLTFPDGATLAFDHAEQMGSYDLPVAAWEGDSVPTLRLEGAVTRQAWQIDGETASTLQTLDPLRKQLQADGFDILFECDARICGGYDFRYATDTLQEPYMHVDLSDFRYLAARHADGTKPLFVSLLVSRSAQRNYVQLVRIGPPDQSPGRVAAASAKNTETPTIDTTQDQPLNEQLDTIGRAVLSDLSFEIGSSRLAAGSYGSLEVLAAYLATHPNRRIVLVGHTDAEGSLTNNIALSKKRAASVMNRLIDDHGVPRAQVAADGVGFLSPLASNLTNDGRSVNRRVEVILSTTE